MQIYLIENMDRSIYFITDTCEDLGDVANEHPEETWIVRPIKMKICARDLPMISIADHFLNRLLLQLTSGCKLHWNT